MNLSRRDEQLVEAMDDSNCDQGLFLRTHRQLATINSLLCRWRWLYLHHIRSQCLPGQSYRLLDVGCGTGHLLITLADWARQDQIDFEPIGIDLDARAFAIAASGLTLRQQSIQDLAADNETFDFVVCNHVLHHLPTNEITEFLAAITAVTRRCAIVNDIARSNFAYRTFPLVGCCFRNSWILPDGLLSIRRSFTPHELLPLLPPAWRTQTLPPSRLVARYNASL